MQDSVAGWLLTFTCIGLSPTRFTKLNLAHNAFYLRPLENQGKSEAEVFDGFTVVNKFAEGGDTNFKVK
jgi:hypothetical protein